MVNAYQCAFILIQPILVSLTCIYHTQVLSSYEWAKKWESSNDVTPSRSVIIQRETP